MICISDRTTTFPTVVMGYRYGMSTTTPDVNTPYSAAFRAPTEV